MWATGEPHAEVEDLPPTVRKCQACKTQQLCHYVEDPALLAAYDEVEMVWLCRECYEDRGGDEREFEDRGSDESEFDDDYE